jgi:hypothetical protein
MLILGVAVGPRQFLERALLGVLRLPQPCAGRVTSWARIVLDVTIEARLSPADPIGSVVVVSSRARGLEAEENVAGRPDDDSRMPVPHDQIAGLGVGDALKAFDSGVEIVGVRVGVGEARAFVNGVDQVRAIVLRVSRNLRIERRRNHAQTVVWSQGAIRFSRGVPTRARPRVVGSLNWARGLLRGAHS